MRNDPHTNLEVNRILACIRRAEYVGIAIDDSNVVDLLADNFPDFTLTEIRLALREAGLSSRFPKACYT